MNTLDGVSFSIVQNLYKSGALNNKEVQKLSDGEIDLYDFYDNEYVTLVSGDTSIQTWVHGDYIYKLDSNISLQGISPRNPEQVFLAHALMEESIKMVTVTGEAGTGKTLLTLAAAIELMNPRSGEPQFERIVFTKPRTQVTDGEEPMGELPGDVLEKMAPQMASYESSLRKILGSQWKTWFEMGLQKEKIMIMPLEHMRGVNFENSIVICDEAQNVGIKQYKTLVTRMDASSKLICMGDVRQTDRDHDYDNPLLEVARHVFYEESSLTAFIELKEVERGPLVDLMIKISNQIEDSR